MKYDKTYPFAVVRIGGTPDTFGNITGGKSGFINTAGKEITLLNMITPLPLLKEWQG